METFHSSILLGGFTFFFFGLKSARDGLQVLAGGRLRAILAHLTSNRFVALFFGAVVTVIVQSSGATSAMLISFVETELVSLSHAIAVLLGADIGTTVTVFLLSLRGVTDYALIIITLGFFIQVLSRHRSGRNVGSVVMGFGFIFYGMHLMLLAAIPLKEGPLAAKAFEFLSGNPFATLMMAIFLSGALHSAGTIGIAIALAFAGAITFPAAVPIVLGANIGTCITAIICGVASGIQGRRVALAHTLTKVVGVAVVFLFLPQVITFVESICAYLIGVSPLIDPGVAGRIVMTHVLLNAALAIVFLPLVRLTATLVTKLLPTPPWREEVFGPKYLDKSALETPALAFAQVKREIVRIAEIVSEQLNRCLRMFSKGLDPVEEIEEITMLDDKVDLLEKETRFYLARLSSEKLSEDDADRQLALMAIGQDLEEIGDILSREMVALANKKAAWHRIFSDEGWEDLKKCDVMVRENFDLALSVLAHPAPELTAKVVRHEERMAEMEQLLRQSHLSRLQKGLRESFDTSSIHLDILSNLRRINTKITHIVELAAKL